jgi:hypothetical protein
MLQCNALEDLKSIWSRRLESNQRPAVYETAALPTELRRRWMTAETKAGAKRRHDSQEIGDVSIMVFRLAI